MRTKHLLIAALGSVAGAAMGRSAALAQVRPDIGSAVLLPAPDVDLVLRIAGDDRLLPEKATSFQPKPSLGVLIRSLRAE